KKAAKENRGLLGALLPHRPKRESSEKRQNVVLKGKQRLVWTLRKGKPAAVPVTVGVTDGRMTEVLAGNIKEGMSLLTNMVIPRNE
ncbi:MAG: efflux RND transporter periplasmic adaptor subunit, partial [Deltaproteobacteria bacterium]